MTPNPGQTSSHSAYQLVPDVESIDFGYATLEGAPVFASIELENRSLLTIEVQSLGMEGLDPGDFGFSLQRGGGFQLKPGETRLLQLAFTPTQRGPRYASLVVNYTHQRAGGTPPATVVPVAGLAIGPVLDFVAAVRKVWRRVLSLVAEAAADDAPRVRRPALVNAAVH